MLDEPVPELVHLSFKLKNSPFICELTLFEFEGPVFDESLKLSDSVVERADFEDHFGLVFFSEFFEPEQFLFFGGEFIFEMFELLALFVEGQVELGVLDAEVSAFFVFLGQIRLELEDVRFIESGLVVQEILAGLEVAAELNLSESKLVVQLLVPTAHLRYFLFVLLDSDL